MKRVPGKGIGAPILALILTVAAGCASTPKPVKCDARLEPINKPALSPNATLSGKSARAADSSSLVPAIEDRGLKP
jgi:hypothetical protein